MPNKDNKPEGAADKEPAKKPVEAQEASAKPSKKKASSAAGTKAKKASPGPESAKAKAPVPRAPLAPKTVFMKNGEVKEQWRLVDATGQTLGRLSSYIATILMGKDKACYTPFSDTGDHVVVINAEKVRLTGKKWEDKTYHWHTNYPGGIKSITARQMREEKPERLVELAVYRMLPKSKGHMARHWFKKLRVYAGADHPHQAQKPLPVKLPNLGMAQAH